MTFGDFGQYEVDGQTYVTDRDRPQGQFRVRLRRLLHHHRIEDARRPRFHDRRQRRETAGRDCEREFRAKIFGDTRTRSATRFGIFNPAQPEPWRTIVGVAPDMLMQGPFNQQTGQQSAFTFRFWACRLRRNSCTIVVRPHPGQSAETSGPLLGKAIAELDSNLPTYFGGTPARLHDEILGVNRITANLFTIFGVVAFLLSAVGLYGVMSFSVNQRTQEFGIRMALGADARRIFRMVMTQGAWQLGIGLVLGVGAAALLLGVLAAAALQNILFKVNAARSVHLLRRRRSADRSRRRIVFRPGATRDPRQSDRRASS